MKKIGLKTLSILLVLMMFITVITPVVSAADYTVDSNITRVATVVNGDTKTSRGISWTTKAKANSEVQIMPYNLYNGDFNGAAIVKGSSSSFKEGYTHKVLVEGLEPGTKYIYRVGDSSKNSWSDISTFETASATKGPISFIAIADVQASSENSFIYGNSTLNAAFDVMPSPDFVTSLGDFVNDCTTEEWEWFFKSFRNNLAKSTFVPVAGNHDGNLKWNWFNNQFNLGAPKGASTITGVYYSFDYANVHFAVLNTNDMYPMSQQQINWLKNDMNKSDADWKIVLMHRPFYSAGKNVNKPDVLMMRDHLLPVMDELDLDLIFAGHDHVYFRTGQVLKNQLQETTYVQEVYNGRTYDFAVNPKGTVHILPNTAGTKRYKVNENAMSPILDLAEVADQPGKPCFATVTIDGDKLVYDAYTVDVEGTGESTHFDSYAIKKNSAGAATPNYKDLPTDYLSNVNDNLTNFAARWTNMIMIYIKWIPTLVTSWMKGKL